MNSAHRTRARVVDPGSYSREAARIMKRQDKLYGMLVARRTPTSGERNAWLCRAVPFLANALAPKVASAFLTRQFDQLGKQRGWAATRREHLTSIRGLLDGSLADFPATLPPSERAIFDKITNETARAIFRICRALAFHDGDRGGLPVGVFAMSALQAAARLGCSRTRAAHWLAHLVKLPVIRRESPGAIWCADTAPRATLWRWILNVEKHVCSLESGRVLPGGST